MLLSSKGRKTGFHLVNRISIIRGSATNSEVDDRIESQVAPTGRVVSRENDRRLSFPRQTSNSLLKLICPLSSMLEYLFRNQKTSVKFVYWAPNYDDIG